MTNKNEMMVNGRTASEWNAMIIEDVAEIASKEADVIEYAKDVTKAAKKGDMQAIANANRSLAHKLEMLERHLGQIELLKGFALKAERLEAGFGPILEFLDEVYEADMKWYKQVKEAHGGKTMRELREAGVSMVEVMISKMPESEAVTTFKKDLEARYYKLVKQIESKVGAVKSFELNRNGNLSFDGIITGEEGTATITTIGAGGYNIQRAHYRTLVKAAKK